MASPRLMPHFYVILMVSLMRNITTYAVCGQKTVLTCSEQQFPARRPLYPPLEEKSIPWDIFQASHCSNDTSLRTQHMPKMPEQVVLSHAAQFAGHLVT